MESYGLLLNNQPRGLFLFGKSVNFVYLLKKVKLYWYICQ